MQPTYHLYIGNDYGSEDEENEEDTLTNTVDEVELNEPSEADDASEEDDFDRKIIDDSQLDEAAIMENLTDGLSMFLDVQQNALHHATNKNCIPKYKYTYEFNYVESIAKKVKVERSNSSLMYLYVRRGVMDDDDCIRLDNDVESHLAGVEKGYEHYRQHNETYVTENPGSSLFTPK